MRTSTRLFLNALAQFLLWMTLLPLVLFLLPAPLWVQLGMGAGCLLSAATLGASGMHCLAARQSETPTTDHHHAHV